MRVATAAAQVRQQRGPTMHRQSFCSRLRLLFGPRRLRSLGWLDRVAFPAVLVQFFVGKQQWTQRLTQVPFDVVRQQTQKQVRPHTRIDAMPDGPDQQVEALQTTEGL